jgi:rRNA maturation endonuclease Nob1
MYYLSYDTIAWMGAAVPKVKLWGYRCERCGHEWLPRKGEEPKVCPKCKSPYWNTPRKSESPHRRSSRA